MTETMLFIDKNFGPKISVQISVQISGTSSINFGHGFGQDFGPKISVQISVQISGTSPIDFGQDFGANQTFGGARVLARV